MSLSLNKANPIHAVITWVDGDDPAHSAERLRYQTEAEIHAPLSENAANPHRWANNDELSYCLRSIHLHAPWIETIWIVTNGQKADLEALPHALQGKVKYAFHDQIFRGLEDALPTFNSLAIETMLWRIDGLSERFIYFNDDVFLTAPVASEDFFTDNGVVLRGGWRNFSKFTAASKHYDDPAFFNHYMQINAATMIGYPSSRLFSTAHVAHPMLRSVFSKLFEKYGDKFAQSAARRFRRIEQFLPQGLHNHACIKADRAAFVQAKDHFHIYSFYGAGEPSDKVRREITNSLEWARIICVNDLPELEKTVSDIRTIIDRATSGT